MCGNGSAALGVALPKAAPAGGPLGGAPAHTALGVFRAEDHVDVSRGLARCPAGACGVPVLHELAVFVGAAHPARLATGATAPRFWQREAGSFKTHDKSLGGCCLQGSLAPRRVAERTLHLKYAG